MGWFDKEIWFETITDPARITKRTQKVIDHVCTNSSRYVVESFVSDTSLSDRYPICVSRSTKVCTQLINKHNSIQYRCFKKFNEIDFQVDLALSEFELVEHIVNPIESLSLLYSFFNTIL
jgi:hypothetical protein